MRYQVRNSEGLTDEEYIKREAESHDDEYSDRYPFDLGRLKFSKEDVWNQNDHAYKRDTYRRGARKRRLFELIELDTIHGKQVLDYGCGIGHHATFYAMYGATVSGFDISPVGIEKAKEIAYANGVQDLCAFQIANAAALPYADKTFDIAICNAVLHHVYKYSGAREELYRVMKPGGMVFFAEGIRDNRLYRVARLVKRTFCRTHDLGDVDLTVNDIAGEFFSGYDKIYVEQFSLFEKWATQIMGSDYESRLAIRVLYYLAAKFDKALFSLWPSIRKYGLEMVGYASKPM